MKVKLLLLLMFSGCLAGSVFAQEEVVDESASTAVGTRIGGTLKGLNRVSIGGKFGANWLKASEGLFDAVNWNAGGVLELTGNPLWGVGLEVLYLKENHDVKMNNGRNLEGYDLDFTLFGSLNLSNLLAKYRSAGWQKLNIYAMAGPSLSYFNYKGVGRSDGFEYNWDQSGNLDKIGVMAGGLLEYDISKHFALGLEGQGRIHSSNQYVAKNGGRLVLDANLLLRYKLGGEKNVRNVALVNYEPKVVASGGGIDQQALAALAKKLENRLNEQDGVIKKLQDQLKNTQDTLDAVKDRLDKMDKYLRNMGQNNPTNGVNFSRIEFDLGKNVVKSAYYPALDGVVSLVKQYPDWVLLLKGYTDSTGSAAGNLRLSKERANSVKSYLVKKGASANNIQAEGYGQANPIGDNNTAKGRAMNRRVEIELQSK